MYMYEQQMSTNFQFFLFIYYRASGHLSTLHVYLEKQSEGTCLLKDRRA